MFMVISQLVQDHSLVTVFAALFICLMSGWLIAVMFERAGAARQQWRHFWHIGAAFVAGLGVWMTHFLAMIGYRPDLPLTYGVTLTILSVIIGVICVGVPLALTSYIEERGWRGVIGGSSGLGIAAMHMTGMSALSGCIQDYTLQSTILSCLLGMCMMAVCGASRRLRERPVLWSLIFSAAVCSVHFVSIGGTTLTELPDLVSEHSDKNMLAWLIAIGAGILVLGTLFIIVTSKRFDAQEQAHATILATALQNMSNGLVFMKANGRLGLFNQRFVELFDLDESNLSIGMSSDAFFNMIASRIQWDKDKHLKHERAFRARLAGATIPPVDHYLPNDKIVSIDSNPVADGGVVFTFDDVTDERAAQKVIADLAYNDPLTGLPNRRSFWEAKVKYFDRGVPFELLLVDLDRFKAVNDTYGHAVGDALLIEVGKRIRAIIGEDSFLARLGGDELAVLTTGGKETSELMAESLIDVLSQAYVVDLVTARVGCSIGICSADEVTAPEELVQCADVALYEAKRQGRGKFVRYQPGLLETVAQRHMLETDLRLAMSRKEFYLAYQPVMLLDPDLIVGYEALLRWKHPIRGLVSPGEFIPLAEETGLIVDIGRWILNQACQDAAEWDDDRHVAVNVSPIQFKSADFVDTVKTALEVSGLEPSRLELELTETALVEDGELIAKILVELRAIGVRVAMDDFGTGYSSLAHLCEFPLDRIKIDQSFIAAAQNDIHAHAIIKAVVALGRDIGVPTIAEGVETAEQLQLLRDLGCNAVQGYLIGRPEPINKTNPPPLAVNA